MTQLKSKIFAIVTFLFGASSLLLHAQNNNTRLVLDGAYITVSGGTSTNPFYLVVDQPNTYGITRNGTSGHIYTTGQYNFVQWNAGTGTGEIGRASCRERV